jgi:hypothetical protein
MERRNPPISKKPFSYNISDEPIVISKATTDILLKQKNPDKLMALYWFYYQTAKWQNTNNAKATTQYTAKGLHWTEESVRKYKKQLISLKLISNLVSKSSDNRITGHYIHVNFIWNHLPNSTPPSFPEGGTLHTVEQTGDKCFITNNKMLNNNYINYSSLDEDKITIDLFTRFWKLYPNKKGSKGKTLSIWETICNRKNKQAPSWSIITKAIREQKETERWQDPKFIPHASTWLNQSRWLDDPNEMKNLLYNNNKPSNSNGTRAFGVKEINYRVDKIIDNRNK